MSNEKMPSPLSRRKFLGLAAATSVVAGGAYINRYEIAKQLGRGMDEKWELENEIPARLEIDNPLDSVPKEQKFAYDIPTLDAIVNCEYIKNEHQTLLLKPDFGNYTIHGGLTNTLIGQHAYRYHGECAITLPGGQQQIWGAIFKGECRESDAQILAIGYSDGRLYICHNTTHIWEPMIATKDGTRRAIVTKPHWADFASILELPTLDKQITAPLVRRSRGLELVQTMTKMYPFLRSDLEGPINQIVDIAQSEVYQTPEEVLHPVNARGHLLTQYNFVIDRSHIHGAVLEFIKIVTQLQNIQSKKMQSSVLQKKQSDISADLVYQTRYHIDTKPMNSNQIIGMARAIMYDKSAITESVVQGAWSTLIPGYTNSHRAPSLEDMFTNQLGVTITSNILAQDITIINNPEELFQQVLIIVMNTYGMQQTTDGIKGTVPLGVYHHIPVIIGDKIPVSIPRIFAKIPLFNEGWKREDMPVTETALQSVAALISL